MLMTNPDSPLNAHDQVARTIGLEILSGARKPGERLPSEGELRTRFDVSRTVLREAFRTLSAKGLIKQKTRIGTTVSDRRTWNYFDPVLISWKVSLGLDDEFREALFEIRRLIEPRAAALAASHATPEQVAQMRRHVADMASSRGNNRAFALADLYLHLAIAEASSNPLMYSISAVIEAALMSVFEISSPESQAIHDQSVARHLRIVDAIGRGDPVDAHHAMEVVIDEGASKFPA
jgi:DNA-binding FadR family transcriptional regulator